jgi:hypothetical protein
MEDVRLTREQWNKIKKNLKEICNEMRAEAEDEEEAEEIDDVFHQIMESIRARKREVEQFDPLKHVKIVRRPGKGIFIYWKDWYHANINEDGDPVYTKYRLKKRKLASDSKDAGYIHDDVLQPGKSKKKPRKFDFMYAQEFLGKEALKKLPNDHKEGIKIFKRTHA